jgi:hypothetical protein
MWKLMDINDMGINGMDINNNDPEEGPLAQRVEAYIRDKNLYFVVAGSKLMNLRQDTLNQEQLKVHMKAYARCDFSMISIFNNRPSAPFIAADTDPDQGIARVQYLIDFNQEAKEGSLSPFYSKILGAFATHFFSVQPQIERLWFPFVIHDIVGSKMGVEPEGSGTSIIGSR